MEDGKTICARWSDMQTERAPWDSEWQLVGDYVAPRKSNITRETVSGPAANPANKLHDTTAIESARILGSGQSSAIAPAGTQWFAWSAPDGIKSDAADAWYNEKSAVAAEFLAGSTNFHTVLNEALADRGSFGICTIGVMEDPADTLTFQALPVGSFCIEEDAKGNVDTLFFRTHYGIRQLVQMFGEGAIQGNPKLWESWLRFKDKGTNTQHPVIHGVFPRLERDERSAEAIHMPIASVWVAEEGQTVLKRSGFTEMPYGCSRYLKRSGRGQQYGYAPFDECKAAVLAANKTKQIAQVVGQKMAVPPVMIPDNLVGNVDLRPGGKTVFRSGSSAGELPREWAQQGQPQWLLELLEGERETIKRAYQTDMFRMFAEREKVMTAREVTELSAEKLMQFSPSFTLFTADFAPIMNRVFAVLFRAGIFGKPEEIPESVVMRTGGGALVPMPKTTYQSRFALAIRQVQTAAADRLVERALAIAEADPGALDNVDFDAYLRETGRHDGVPEKILRGEKARDDMRKARQEAQAEQAQLMQAAEMAKAAGSLGMKV